MPSPRTMMEIESWGKLLFAVNNKKHSEHKELHILTETPLDRKNCLMGFLKDFKIDEYVLITNR